MGRRPSPKERAGAGYVPGKPKRIALSIFRPGLKRETAHLSTAEARAALQSLASAIAKAEADKATTKKRNRRPSVKTVLGVQPKLRRAKRIELAAINLSHVLNDLVGEHEGAAIELIGNDDLSASLMQAALNELHAAIGEPRLRRGV